MDVTQLQLDDVLNRLEWTQGSAAVELAEQACALSDTIADEAQQFRCRERLADALSLARHPAPRQREVLEWLRTRYDANPEWMTAQQRFSFLWRLKWAPGRLTSDPDASLEEIEELLDLIEEYYVDADEGLAPVLALRHYVASVVGVRGACDGPFEAWQDAPRTRLSDCAGCELTEIAQHFMEVGREEDALRIAEDLLATTSSCSEQPQSLISMVLPAMLSHHQTELAWQEFLRASRTSRQREAEFGNLGLQLAVLARSGNWQLGLGILADCLPLQMATTSPGDTMWFAARAVALLETAAKHTDLSAFRHVDGKTYDLAALLSEQRELALELARKFDARNRNDHISVAIAELWQAPPLPRLPDPFHRHYVRRLTESRFGPGNTEIQLVDGSSGDVIVSIPEYSVHPLAPYPHDIEECDLTQRDGVLALSAMLTPLSMYSLGALEKLVQTRWREHAHRWVHTSDDPELMSAVADLQFHSAWRSTDGDERALTEIADAVRLFRAADEVPRAISAEVLQTVLTDQQENITALIAEIDERGTLLDRIELRDTAHRMQLVDVFTGRVWIDEACDLVDELMALPNPDEQFEPDKWRRIVAKVLLRRPVDSAQEAHADATTVLGLVEPTGDIYLSMMAHSVLVISAIELQDFAEAERHIDKGEALAVTGGGWSHWGWLHGYRYDLLALKGNNDAAENVLWRCYTSCDADPDDTVGTVLIRAKLAEFLNFHDRTIEAATLVDEALTFAQWAQSPAAGRLHHRAKLPQTVVGLCDVGSELCESLGEHARALSLAQESLAIAQERGPAGKIPYAQARVAELLTPENPLAAAKLFDDALRSAEQQGLHRLALVIRRDASYAKFEADGALAAETDLEEALAANARLRGEILVDEDVAFQLENWDFDFEELHLQEMRVRLRAASEDYQGALSLIHEHDLVGRLRSLGLHEMALSIRLNEGRFGLLIPALSDTDALGIIEEVAVEATELGSSELAANAAWVLVAHARDSGEQARADALIERFNLAE